MHGVMLTGKEQAILDALEPRAAQMGVEIVTVELVGARKAPTIRVYIDTDHGVGFDELVSAQQWVDEVVEAIDPFPGAYTIEVSSPGIDRPLRTPEHFARYIGETVVLKTQARVDGRTAFKGTLTAADADAVQLECEDGPHSIPMQDIKRANLKGTIDFKSKE